MNRQIHKRTRLLLSMAFALPAHGMCDSVPCTLGIRDIIAHQVIPGLCTTTSKLDNCCTNITTDFNTTWTMLNRLESKIESLEPCNATPLFTPQTINTPGSYCLAQDITLSPGDIGFTIAAPNVVFDLNNQTISGGAAGVIITGTTATVKNGTIANMSGNGISVQANQCVLHNCMLVGNGIGMNLTNATQTNVTDCRALGNTQAGFSLQNASHNIFTHCAALAMTAASNLHGFVSTGGTDNIFTLCCAEDIHATGAGSSAAGFALTSGEISSRIAQSSVNYITTDTTLGGAAYGIHLVATETCQVVNNTVFSVAGNPGVGIFADSSRNYVASNVSCDNNSRNYSRIDELFLGSQANAQGVTNIDCSLPNTPFNEAIDFSGTYTMLTAVTTEGQSIESKCEAISDNITLIPSQFPIEQGTAPRTALFGQGVYQSGSYFLQENIREIYIQASNVTIDLNGFSVTGGIFIYSDYNTITIKNGTIDTSFTRNGILFYGNNQNILLSNVLFTGGEYAIRIGESGSFGNVQNLMVQNCRFTGQTESCISNDANSGAIDGLRIRDCLFDGSMISGITPGANIGISSPFPRSTNIKIENSQFIVATTGCKFDYCDNLIIRNCSLQGIAENAKAISCTSCKKIALEQCKAEKTSQGFLMLSCNDVSISECESLGLAGAENIGFSLSIPNIGNPPTTKATLERCIATNLGIGFKIDNSANRFALKRCIAQNNTVDGFQLNTSGTGIVKGCKAEANGQYGFNDSNGSTIITYVANVASSNGTANYNPDNNGVPPTNPPFNRVSLIDSPTYWENAVQ